MRRYLYPVSIDAFSLDGSSRRHFKHRNEQSKKVSNQALGTSSGLLNNANTAFSNTGNAVNKFNQNLDNFMRFGRRTYGANGEFARDLNTQATTTAAAGNNALRGDLALNAMRTGANTTGYANTEAEARRQGQRDLTDQLAKGDQQRLAALTQVENTGLDASKFPAQVYSSLYGPSSSGAVGALNPAASSARQADQNIWDQYLNSAIQGGAAVGAAAVGGGKH